MKRILKIIIILLITIFSFYYTNLIIDLAKSKDPIMKDIKKYKKERATINGIISNTTMLVGTSGEKIDIDKSYQKMKIAKEFNKNLLEYTNIKPEITKKNNIKKQIIGKNTTKKEISFIFEISNLEDLRQISYICSKNNIKTTFFIDTDILKNNIEEIKQIIGDNTIGIKEEKVLPYEKKEIKNNFGNYSNYCLYKDETFLIICSLNKVNTIKPKLIEKNLYNYIKENKKNGYIYEIKTNKTNLKQLNSTILYLKQKGYKIPSINKLLQE